MADYGIREVGGEEVNWMVNGIILTTGSGASGNERIMGWRLVSKMSRPFLEGFVESDEEVLS